MAMVSLAINGSRLRDARKALRLSGPNLAALSGVSQPMISQIERGLTRVGPGSFSQIVAALAQSGGFDREELADWLLGGPVAPIGTPIIDS